MTEQPDPVAFPGADDEAIEQASDDVVQTWNEAAPGKEPNATPEDFKRMREGMSDLAAGGQADGER